MLVGCTVPLLLIFLAPALGLSENFSLLLFILAMFACHLFMPHGHRKHQQNHSSTKTTQNEQHQY
jgi:positive regulator of sigma E activity